MHLTWLHWLNLFAADHEHHRPGGETLVSSPFSMLSIQCSYNSLNSESGMRSRQDSIDTTATITLALVVFL